jgi:hypothetical protein
MKRAMLLVLMCMVFTTTVVSVNASAGEGKQRVYRGRLSNGYKMAVDLVLREGEPPALREIEFGVDMTCDDGTLQTWFSGPSIEPCRRWRPPHRASPSGWCATRPEMEPRSSCRGCASR